MWLRAGSWIGSLMVIVWGPGQLLAGMVYWTDRDHGRSVRRGPLDGSGYEILLDADDGLVEPRGLGLDLTGGKLYLGDAGTGTIYRANLDGSQLEELVTGLPFLADLEVDATARKVYWSEWGGQSGSAVCRANFDGSDVETLFSDLTLPYFMDLDIAGGKIYWAENNNTVIHIGNMDGSGDIVTLEVGTIRIRDVAVDTLGGKIYWGERDIGLLQRCNLDGSDVETLYDESDGLIRPHGVEIDPLRGRIYWTDTRTYAIHRGNMDGSGPPEVIYGNLPDAWDLELQIPIPEPSLWGMMISGLFCLAWLRWLTRRRW